MFDTHLLELSQDIGRLLREKNKTVATAESCTGGSVAALLTSIPGSSDYVQGGIVAYSNEVKKTLLHVREETLRRHGAVSEQTVVEMVKGAVKSLESDYAVATSGIAGPGGGTPDKPVGTVWIAAGCKDQVLTCLQQTDMGREINVEGAVENALNLLKELLLKA